MATGTRGRQQGTEISRSVVGLLLFPSLALSRPLSPSFSWPRSSRILSDPLPFFFFFHTLLLPCPPRAREGDRRASRRPAHRERIKVNKHIGGRVLVDQRIMHWSQQAQPTPKTVATARGRVARASAASGQLAALWASTRAFPRGASGLGDGEATIGERP